MAMVVGKQQTANSIQSAQPIFGVIFSTEWDYSIYKHGRLNWMRDTYSVNNIFMRNYRNGTLWHIRRIVTI